MSRLDRAAIIESLTASLPATADPDGVVDLVAAQGRINVAAEPAQLRSALERLRPLDGYRWVAINAGDLFAVNPLTIGSKVGIMDTNGKVLKAADLPRPK
jgi:hypothetical protein